MNSNQTHSSPVHDLESFHLDPDLKQVLIHLESTMHSWSDLRIAELIDVIETTIRKNHLRLLELDSNRSAQREDLGRMKQLLESENHYLARTILPLLFDHVTRKGSRHS